MKNLNGIINNSQFLILLLIFIFASCNNQNNSSTLPKSKQVKDTGNQANSMDKNSTSIVENKTEHRTTENNKKPGLPVINTTIDTTLLFGIWTMDPDGPHADFHLTGKSFYVVDYDGDGDMHYELKGNQLKIYYPDFVQDGKIYSVDEDTLKIHWNNSDITSSYVHWKN